MNNASIGVFREIQGRLERVGTLSFKEGSLQPVSFSYESDYLLSEKAAAISHSMPLQEESFDSGPSRVFFQGLLPEGPIERMLLDSLRLESSDYIQAIGYLNDESVGALVLGIDTPNWDNASYEPIGKDTLEQFASSPTATATALGMKTRRSLAGAQPKLGLYHTGNDFTSNWFIPHGIAPTTHIIKNSNAAFAGDSINEALCMEMARANDLPTATVLLVPLDHAEPLLATQRFDRYFPSKPRMVSGLPTPWRRHQEDMTQSSGIALKYEPTDASYASLVSRQISVASSDAFGDKALFFYALCFDFLIGNCDNHLKNFSFLWSPDWKGAELSPLYDVANTTLYPNVYREMGISLCQSRCIDDVRPEDITRTGSLLGLGENIAWGAFCELCDNFSRTLDIAQNTIITWGFPQVKNSASKLMKDAQPRLALANKDHWHN